MTSFLPKRLIPLIFVLAVEAIIFGGDLPCFCNELKLAPALPPESESSALAYPAWWGTAPPDNKRVPCKEAGSCATCHQANATMDPIHAIACVECHKGNPEKSDQTEAHEGLISDPGDLRTVNETCGRCHPEQSRRVAASAMSLAPRMINHTRFAFGSRNSPSPSHATVDFQELKQVPHPSESLGDDLLRRACLRCHLRTRGSRRWGEHRGLGCSACHVAYPNDAEDKHVHALTRNVGMTACLKCHNANHVGSDYIGLFEKDSERGFRSPFKGGKQAPGIYGSEQHRLVADVHFKAGMTCMDCHTLDEVHGNGKVSQSTENGVKITCEGCHVRGDHPAVRHERNGNFTLLRGKIRPGLTADDAENAERTKVIHRPATQSGDSVTSAMSSLPESRKRDSSTGRIPDKEGHSASSAISAVNDRSRIIPKVNENIIPHRVQAHRKRLRCSACHAAWSFQDYGLHLILEERADYWKWAGNAAQNDPQVQEILKRNIGTDAELVSPAEGAVPAKPEDKWEPPASFDWLTGEKRGGAWFHGYTERTWSRPPLGLDGRGRISVMRPMHQYVISHVDANSSVLVDRHVPQTTAGFPALIMNPYAPHSIGPRGRSCHECHGDPKAAGLGDGMRSFEKKGEFKPLLQAETKIPGLSFRWNALVDEKGNPLQYSSHPSAGPLDAATVFRLLNPSDYHRALWYRYLSGDDSSGP